MKLVTKMFAMLVFAALVAAAQSTPITLYAYSVSNLPIISGMSQPPVVFVWISDNRYDGYRVSVSGTDVNGQPFSLSQRVEASGMPWTLVAFAVNAQGAVQATAVGFKYDQSSAGISRN